MKISDSMRFPHPVLSEITSDYLSGSFEYNFLQQTMENGSLKLCSQLSIANENLSKLIADGQVAIGFYLICRTTFYDELHITTSVDYEIIIPKGMLFGQVVVRPIAWTTADDIDLSSNELNPEFIAPRVPKGTIVALGLEHTFSMDPMKFQALENIFELAKDDTISPGIFLVDLEGDRIKLVAQEQTFERINFFRTGIDRNYLLSCVYLPALVEALSRKTDEDKRWYQVLKAKSDELGIQIETQTPLECAQLLLKQPLHELFEIMESVDK